MSADANPTPPANIFAKLFDAGYTRLVPVLPCDAEVRDRSSLNRKGARGKAVGVRGRDGLWHGYDWVRHECDVHDLERWHAMGADIGIKGGAMPDGTTLVFIDADTKNYLRAELIEKHVAKLTPGQLPKRVGQAPKAAYPIRVSAPYAYTRIEFGDRTETNALSCRVEILSEGRYLKVYGIHPDTGEPYVWLVPLCKFEDLPIVSPERLDQLLRDLAEVLPAATELKREGASAVDVDQESLRGDPAAVARIVSATPNTTALFPTRESYLHFGYAIRAAMPDDEPGAFALFADWCARWQDGENAEEVIASDWRRMKPPYKRGMNYLVQEAERASGGAVGRADLWFDGEAAAQQPDEASALFGEPAVKGEVPPLRAGRIDPNDLIGLPPRQWLYGTKISRRYVTFLASPGGVGKTAYVFAMALAAAASLALLHDSTKRPLRVWIYNLEDDIVELRRRLAAAMKHYGLDSAVLDNIRINSGRDRRFRIVQAHDGNFVVLPDFRGVIEEMRAEQIDILVVDPYLRSHGVSENENEAQDEVMRLYADIAEATNAGIVLVHHTKKGAVAGDMDSLRGGSTQGGGARAAYTLSPMAAEDAEKLGIPDEERRLYVRMDDAKNNMAPPAQRAEWLKLASVSLGNGTEDYPAGDNVQVATAWTPPAAWSSDEEGAEDRILAALAGGPVEGERYSIRTQDKDRWAGDVLVRELGCSVGQAKATLESWTKQGRIFVSDYMSPGQRKLRKGLYVKTLAEVGGEGIFG